MPVCASSGFCVPTENKTNHQQFFWLKRLKDSIVAKNYDNFLKL